MHRGQEVSTSLFSPFMCSLWPFQHGCLWPHEAYFNHENYSHNRLSKAPEPHMGDPGKPQLSFRSKKIHCHMMPFMTRTQGEGVAGQTQHQAWHQWMSSKNSGPRFPHLWMQKSDAMLSHNFPSSAPEVPDVQLLPPPCFSLETLWGPLVKSDQGNNAFALYYFL